jgi:hypothetical protein
MSRTAKKFIAKEIGSAFQGDGQQQAIRADLRQDCSKATASEGSSRSDAS